MTALVLIVLVLVAGAAVYVWAIGRVRVPTGKAGLVYRKYGPHHPGDIFKVRIHGSTGWQADTLRGDLIYFKPRFLYRIEFVPITVVPPGTIGVVVAQDGAIAPPNQMLGRSVSCNHFQDGRAFLEGGGQQGRQPDVLAPGRYNINPYLFQVLTVENIGAGNLGLTATDLREISVPEGSTAVVIALEGAPPDDDDRVPGRKVPGHESFQLPTVFLENGGQRGAQSETLGRGGIYRINPWFARVVLIPTRDLILVWSDKGAKTAGRFDSALGPITVNIEGHEVRCTLSQTIRIPPRSAPSLVGRFGEQETDHFGISSDSTAAPIMRFVDKVLATTVENYFQATAAEYRIDDFLRANNEVRLNLEERVRQELDEWSVEAIRTALGEFEVKDEGLNVRRRKLAEERQQKVRLEHVREYVSIEAEIEKTRIGIEAERRKLDVAAEVELLNQHLAILGRNNLAMKVFLAELAKMNVPQYVGADPALLQQYVPLHVAQNLITKAMNSVEASPDDVVPAGELVGDAAKAAALAEDDWRPLSAQDDRGADGQERQEGED